MTLLVVYVLVALGFSFSVVLTLLILFLSEIIPKTIGARWRRPRPTA